MTRAEDVFKASDFQSIELFITLKNLTTRTEVKNEQAIQLVGLEEKILIFEVPSKTCNTNHNVFFEIYKIEGMPERKLSLLCSLTGKIIEVESLSEDTMKIEVQVVQVDEESWGKLENLFSRRQEDITKFLAMVKG